MDFGNPSGLFSALLISCLGMGYFLYGKKAARLWPLLAGIALSVYPFFITSVLLMWLIAGAIVAGVYMARDR